LALWFRSESFSLAKLRKLALALLLVGGTISTYLLTTSGKGGQESLTVYSFLAVAFCGLIGFAAVDSLLPRPIYALLTNPVARYIGKISYGLYLLHPIAYYLYNFLIGILHSRLGEDTFWKDALSFVGEVGLVFLLASLSWYLFEQPILKFKSKFTRSAEKSGTYATVQIRSAQTGD
jgi:peptidoglycan/LPS O-acetylase OafA/YrhL